MVSNYYFSISEPKGPDTIRVDAESNAIYEFDYTGQNFKLENAGRIYFASKETGEFWYVIHAEAHDQLPESFGPIEAEFGGWAEFQLPYYNGSDTSTEVTIQVIRFSCF